MEESCTGDKGSREGERDEEFRLTEHNIGMDHSQCMGALAIRVNSKKEINS